ncbi:hypothetical protein NAT47_07045 [Flavobacterium sp. HXWNR69]|uniref:Uncharacterized protein n=1 Tax=Flavobacterium fragile TaxID=2949085 RepID=A0ABT0TGT2_9FLAO|nr:hypothetical protein [Flavobacterium sp. HXWNR69]MCL9770168.1 hypothetical protein [Flavobacterium sp. HXWNR69]
MKKFIIISLLSILFFSFSKDCQNCNIGTFEWKDKNTIYTIIRTKHKLISKSKYGIVKNKLKWTSDSTYILYDMKIVKGKVEKSDLKIGNEKDMDTLYVQIIQIDNEKHKLLSKFKNSEFVTEYILTKVNPKNKF